VRKTAALLLACTLGLATLAPAARAQTSLGIDAAGVSQHFLGDWMLGYRFTAVNSFSVASLGFYDRGGDGLAASHQVGLWDTSGNLLASAVISAGSVDPLVGLFRMATLGGAVALTAGQSYVVAGRSGGDAVSRTDYSGVSGFQVNANITGLSLVWDDPNPAATLSVPTRPSPETYAYFAGNFGVVQSGPGTVTPEPAGLVLLGSGLVGVAFGRRRGRARGVRRPGRA
jgi:hypothetical protein